MSEGCALHLTKGGVHAKVDALANHTTTSGQFDKRAAFLAAVKNATNPLDYIGILQTQASISQEQALYLKDFWYNTGPGGWWPWLQPCYPILKEGLVKALEEAGTTLILDSYWWPAGFSVEVLVAKSARQVTRIIVTPPSPPPLKQRNREDTNWVVRRGTPADTPSKKTLDQLVEAVKGDIVTWKTLEF